MLTVAVAGTLMAIAVPVAGDLTASVKLNEAARLVEREFQDARLRAVSTNRPLRVRINCPTTGLIRTVEVLATSADSASNRCLQSAYPFPPPDDNMMTRPNYDGPVHTIPNNAAAPTLTLEFRPDGTVMSVVAGVAQPIASEQSVSISRHNQSRTLRINGAGKIQLQ